MSITIFDQRTEAVRVLFRLLSFSCLTAALAGVLACRAAPARDLEETVAQASPYQFGLWSVPDEPILSRATAVTYFLHLPAGYEGSRPCALVLAVSAGDVGRDMFPSWAKAAREYGLIFACPNQAGNEVRADVRGQMVMDTLHDVRQKYAVDPERIFITGFSGGARMATGVALKFPGLFAGLAPMGGITYFNDFDGLAGLRLKRGAYLFAGESDFNREESERAREIIDRAGIPVALMIAPGAGHERADPDQCLEIYRWFLEK